MLASACTEREYIITGFRRGFRLGVDNTFDRSKRENVSRASPPLMDKLQEEIQKHRIIGPFEKKPFQDLLTSPLHVIPKPESKKMRMIFNLSYPTGHSVNDHIKDTQKSVHYCSVMDVGHHLLEKFRPNGAWMAKVDLSDAYRLVPINQLDWRFLGIKMDGKYYIDRMLPMGAASSCRIFQRFSDALKEIFLSQFKRASVFNYLDDFLFVAHSHADCEEALQAFQGICDSLQVPIAAHKTVHASRRITFLGLGIDAENYTLYIPQEKGEKAKLKIMRFLGESAPRVKSWQSIIGTLNHLSQVVVSGRILLSSMYERLVGILSQKKHLRRSITRETRQDMESWLNLLHASLERKFRVLATEDSELPPLITDASTSRGFGAVWGTQWFVGRWPEHKTANIATLELYPIFLALSLSQVEDATILIYTDNQALVPVINKLYCKDASLRKLMRPIVDLCLTKNVRLIASHISGKENIGPDLLSRGKVAEFLHVFPQMNARPVQIPPYLTSFKLIDWKAN